MSGPGCRWSAAAGWSMVGKAGRTCAAMMAAAKQSLRLLA